MNPILANIEEHWQIYTTAGTALFVAFVCTWPANIPRSAQEWWTWFRDAFQTAVPAARVAHSGNPTQPVTPAKTNS